MNKYRAIFTYRCILKVCFKHIYGYINTNLNILFTYTLTYLYLYTYLY